MLTGTVKMNGNTPILVCRIQDLSNLSWQVHFSHTRQKDNINVDWLPNFNLQQNSCDAIILKTPTRDLYAQKYWQISLVFIFHYALTLFAPKKIFNSSIISKKKKLLLFYL